MALKKFTNGGGAFLDKKVALDAEVILFEPTKIERDVPSSNPRFGAQDIVHAAVTLFNPGEEPKALGTQKVTGKALTSDLEDYLGEQVAARMVLMPNKNGGNDFPVLRPADSRAEARVEKYIEERDAAIADAPDFLS